MKNITITLKEEVAHWARVWAARNDTSVSKLLGEMLDQKMRSEMEYEEAKNRFLSKEPVDLNKTGRYPSREQIHGRNMLR